MAKTSSTSSTTSKKTPAMKKATPKTTSSRKNKTPRTLTKSPASSDQGTITSSETTLYEDNTREYYSHIKYIPQRDKFMKSDPLLTPTFSQQDDNNNWSIKIGDLACIQNPSPGVGSSNKKKTKATTPSGKLNTTSPFTVTWRACQILSFFRDKKPKKLSTKKYYLGPLQMEVRWFYNHNDLDERNKRYERKLNNNNKNMEVFESNHVVVLDASLLLGRLVLNEQTISNEDCLKYPVPTVVKSCHRYYFHNEKDVIGLYDLDNIVLRGLECSVILQKMSLSWEEVYNILDITTTKSNSDDDDGDQLVTLPSPSTYSIFQNQVRVYYPSCTLTYPWSELKHGNLIHPTSCEKGNEWQLCVGDIVAVPCVDSTAPNGSDIITGRNKWYPYTVPWSHGQVTALYRSVDRDDVKLKSGTAVDISSLESETDISSLTCQIRWFPRISEALSMCQEKSQAFQELNRISNDSNRTCEEILEGDEITNVECDSLLGPVHVADEGSNNAEPLTHIIKRTISKTMYCNEKGNPCKVKANTRRDPTHRVQRGLDASTLYNNKGGSATKQSKMSIMLDSVVKSRKERAQHISTNMPRQDNIEVDEEAMLNDNTVVAGDIAAEPVADGEESSPHKKRELFTEAPKRSWSGNWANCGRKRPRSDDDMDESKEVAKAPQDRTETTNTVDAPLEAQNERNKEEVDNEEKDEPSEDILPESRATCCINPFHVDVSALKSFYEEIEMLPPVDSYDDTFTCATRNKEVKWKWKVKLGDTVTLQVESSSKEPSIIHYPFAVQWAPAEVVSIYRVHKTKESCVKLREKSAFDNLTQDADDEIMMEVRWLYRSWEIPGASKTKKKVTSDSGNLEEVFETDQIDVCSADSILSPVKLHDVPRPTSTPSSELDMPLIHYQCSRLWSIHRRSFVPSGSLSNRISRGRMYSAYKMAFDQLNSISTSISNTSSREQTWKEAFQSAIRKLSLAEAAQDTQEHGMALTCREQERKQITSFLKKAIHGLQSNTLDDDGEDEETKNLKSSLFIAGPPGTGKTASVRSIISELQKEQHEGLLPEFNFIALNGMELRHPFDAYVKFWEAVSGPRKERLTAGDAVFHLEQYFCGADQNDEMSDNEDKYDDDEEGEDDAEADEESEVGNNGRVAVSERPVTVLMLDEIDYLVTKKETLVYNFFDWPLRATTARLVVIGISNTINLPEKLSTRVQSRIGGDRCHFRSYNVKDTITILKTRLGMLDANPGHPVFEEDAIKFAARKTANLSGDIRKAFHMCKVAAETVFEEYSNGKRQVGRSTRPIVRISDVQRGSRDMFTSIVLKAVSCSTDYEALLLISLGALKKDRDDGSFPAKEILVKIESIANASGDRRYMNARLSFADVLGMMNRLGDAGIVQLNTYASSPFPWVSTHLHSYEILASFRDTRHSKLAEKHLANQRLF